MTELGMAAGVVLGTVLFGGGVLKGTAGFGDGLVSTAVLALVFTPAEAVTAVIAPLVAANASLAADLDAETVTHCSRRFAVFIAAALTGTLAGTALVGVLPATPFKVVLGAITLVFVGLQVRGGGVSRVLPGLLGRPARHAVAGLVSGGLFGLANVGVQLVGFLQEQDLSHRVFVGVLSLILVGIGSLRIGVVWLTQPPTAQTLLLLSVVLIPLKLGGVWTGRHLSHRLSSRHITLLVYALLLAAGVRLITSPL